MSRHGVSIFLVPRHVLGPVSYYKMVKYNQKRDTVSHDQAIVTGYFHSISPKNLNNISCGQPTVTGHFSKIFCGIPSNDKYSYTFIIILF